MNQLIFRWVAAGVLFLCGTGCATTSQFPGGAYKSAGGVVSCRVPGSGLGGWTVEKVAGAGGSRSICFTEDYSGALYKIEMVNVRALSQSFQNHSPHDQLTCSIEELVLPLLRSVSPATSLVKKDYRADFRGGATSAAFLMPGGSPVEMTDGTGKRSRADITRNVVVFRSGKWLIFVTHIGNHIAVNDRHEKAAPPLAQAARDLPQLLEFARSIEVAP